VRSAAALVGALLVLALSTVLGVLLHLNLPCARRLAVAQVDTLLRPTFKGTLELVGIDRLRLRGVDGLQVRIKDPDGVTVIVAQGTSARISAWAVVRSALFGKEEIDIALSKVTIDHVDLNLDIAPDGILRLVHAVEPRAVKAPAGAPGRGVRIALPDVQVNHSWIHGPVGGTPLIDVETLALRGAVFFRNKQALVDVAHVAFAARGLPQGLNPAGELEAHLAVPSKTGRDIGVEATFAGVLGSIPVTLQGRMDGPHVEATIDLPRVASEQLRVLVPQAPLFAPVGAHVQVHGELPTLEAVAHVAVGDGSADATAKLQLSDVAPSGTVHLRAERIDARAFSLTAPRSDLGVDLSVTFAGKPGGPVAGELSADVPRGMIAEQVVPHTTVHGDFTVDPRSLGGAKTLHAKGRVAEEGAPVDFTVDMRPVAPLRDGAPLREVVSVAATSDVPSLPYVRRLATLPKGRGHLDVKGTLSLPDGALEGTATAEVLDVEHASASVESVKLVARASGTLHAPVVESTCTVEGVRAGQFAFSHTEVTTSGPLLQQKLDVVAKGSNTPDVELHAELDARASLTAHAVTLSARRDGIVALARADSLHASGGELSADGVVVEGLGSAVSGSIRLTPSGVGVRGGTMGIDRARRARLFGVGALVNAGEASFDVDFDARKEGAHGTLVVDVARLSVADMNDLNAHVDARMEGRRITGSGRASIDQVGTVDLNSSVIEVGGGGPLRPESWKRAWGQVGFSGMLDLARLARLLPKNTLPFGELAGQVYFEATGERESESDFTPALTLSARTNGLVVAGICPPARPGLFAGGVQGLLAGPSRPAADAKKCVPWRSSGVDLQLDSDIDGESGFAELAVRAADKAGVVVALDVKSQDLPYASLLAASSSGGSVLPLLEQAGFVAEVVMPARHLDALPSVVPPLGITGEVQATVEVTGTVVEPHVSVVAKGRGLRAPDAPLSVAMGADVGAQYDGKDAKVTVGLRTAKEEVLDGTVTGVVPMEALLRGELGAWFASVTAKVTRFPLAAFPVLQDHNVRGHVSGALSLEDFHKDARGSLKVTVDDLQVGHESYAGGEIEVATEEHALAAVVHIAQPTGGVDATAKTGLRWGSSLVPAIDETQPATASLRAKHFQAGALRPLVIGSLSELDGIVDGHASLELIPKTGSARMKGLLTLDDGLVQLSSTGQEFHKIHAKLTLSPSGVVRLEDVTALGLSGRVMASGVARLNGLKLAEARLDVKIPKGHAIPLDVAGAEMGEVDGDLSVVVTSPKPRLVSVDVKVPTLHVQLPVANTHTVEGIDAPRGVRVGVYKGSHAVSVDLAAPRAEDDAAQAEAPSELDVSVHLGPDVEVKRGTQLKVALDGNPVVKVTNVTRVSGEIVLKSGTLEVQGKRFEIEKGTVSFVGDDPSNPEAVVTAGWVAPDGTRVYADFMGPLKTGKVTLRSEPALPNNEILALILFGTSDGGTSNPTSASAQNAGASGAAAASGFATEGLSQGFDELTGIEVKGRLDTSDSTNPRPEVEVQIARDISLQIAFVLGTPPPGQNTDHTLATIDWRFFRNWSLATTFGDAGSSMADVVWQYRY
jgi:translocation and assembly module TamB